MAWEKYLEHWVDAQLIDLQTAERIREFENRAGKKRLRWPAILAITFGALMLCSGILLFVSAHWHDWPPSQRFILVLALVAIFHLAGSFLGAKVPAMGVALHTIGTIALGAGIFLAGEIFNLSEHWPNAILLWALGAAVGWLLLRQWPQALLFVVLVPWWLFGEWSMATAEYFRAGSVAAQGLLLLSILFMTTSPKEPHRQLRLGLVWTGALALIPTIWGVLATASDSFSWRRNEYPPPLPISLRIIGYLVAYAPLLPYAWFARKKNSMPLFCVAVWVFLLDMVSAYPRLEENWKLYLYIAMGACLLCYWGVQANRKLFINYGIAIFAIDLIAFYFSSVLNQLGRSMGLILLGVIFLAGGWILNRLRTDLIARAAATGAN